MQEGAHDAVESRQALAEGSVVHGPGGVFDGLDAGGNGRPQRRLQLEVIDARLAGMTSKIGGGERGGVEEWGKRECAGVRRKGYLFSGCIRNVVTMLSAKKKWNGRRGAAGRGGGWSASHRKLKNEDLPRFAVLSTSAPRLLMFLSLIPNIKKKVKRAQFASPLALSSTVYWYVHVCHQTKGRIVHKYTRVYICT